MATKKENLAQSQEKQARIATKRKLELEGFSSDLSNLDKRMVFYQNYISKLKRLVDQDHADVFQDDDPQMQMMDPDQEVILEQVDEE